MYYVEFINSGELVSCATLAQLPKIGDLLQGEELYRIMSTIYLYRNGHNIVLPNGAVCVRMDVKLANYKPTKIERLSFKIIIFVWIMIVAMAVYVCCGRSYSPSPPSLIPGIGETIIEPDAPEPPPKNKGIYL